MRNCAYLETQSKNTNPKNFLLTRPFIDHLRTESGIKTQREIKKQSFQGIKEMAVFR